MNALNPVRGAAALALLASTSIAGCKVVTFEEDAALRARRGAGFDAPAEVRRMWDARALPTLQREARSMAELVPAIVAGLAGAGTRYGHRTGEGAPWTFVGRGEGTVTSVDRTSRRGTVEVALAGLPQPRTVRLQIGPVVAGTAVRDALPFVAFDAFSDQLAFADIGRALTERALGTVRPQIAALRTGARVSFTGAFNVAAPDDEIVITPLTLAKAR